MMNLKQGENLMILFTTHAAQVVLFLLAVWVFLHFLKLKGKRQIALCIVCVAAFACLSSYFSHTFVRVSDEITITALNEANPSGLSTEVDISNIQVDGTLLTSYNVVQGNWYWISGRYGWRPASDTRWDGTATDSITLKVPVGWNRTLNFYTNPWRGYVEVEKADGSREIFDTYSVDNAIHSYQIGRSETKLLLLNGIVQIAAYTCLFLILTGQFFLTVKTGKISMEEKAECREIKEGAVSVTKKQILKSLLLPLGAVAVVTLFALANLPGRVNTKVQILTSEPKEVSAPIITSATYEQTFKAIGSFSCIELQFETFARENQMHTQVELKDETGNTVHVWALDNNSLTSEVTELTLEKAVKKGTYRLSVSSDNQDVETSVGIRMQDVSKCDGELTINGEKQDKDIAVGLYQKTNIGYIRFVFVMIAAVVMAWVAYLLLMVFKPELWKSAFILLLGFGCVFMSIFPAGCANDTWRHYVTAYEYSNKLMIIPYSSSGTVMMRKDDADELQRYFATYSNANRKASILQYDAENDEFSLLCKNAAIVDSGRNDLYRGSSSTAIVAYFPAVIGLTVGRLLALGTIPCMYLARFLSLLAVAALVAVAIKVAPVGKEIFFLISLLPIFLQQIAIFSYDGLAFGYSFLFIALCIKAKYQTSAITMTDYILLMLSAMGLCACRMGMYIVLLCILLLIPKNTMGKWHKGFLAATGITAVVILYGGQYLGGASGAVSTESALNLGSPFQHPIRVGLLFLSSIIENIDVYWGGMLGSQMGWSEAIVPYFCVLVFVVLLLIVSLSDDGVPSLDTKSRAVYMVPPIFTLAFCLLTMYVGENHRATAWNIWGVQGRYFLPVLPLVFFQVQNRWVVLKENVRPRIMTLFCGWEVMEIFYLMRAFITR